MSLAARFIRRPVATVLLTLGVALVGLAAFFQLPAALLPQVDYPVISVRASLPGASPDTMAASVAMPLERALGSIAGVNEITSRSSLGSTEVVLQFDLSRDIDGAARDIQAAINASRSQLPSGMAGNPTLRKSNPNDSPILILAMTSDVLSRTQIYDAAVTILAQKLAQVEGVGQVSVGGSSLPAVRVELNPLALARSGVSAETVRGAIASGNVNRPKGFVEDGGRHWQIGANDQALSAADYTPMIVRWQQGAALRLSDVAEVRDGAQELRNAGVASGRPAVLLMVNRQPNANIIATVDHILKLLPELQAAIPPQIRLEVSQDRSTTVRASLRDVGVCLVLSVLLVVLVVIGFLRDRRAALIPAVTVPVALVGTLALMYLAGFSINNLSLMALTVAAGFVVDDIVVVLENTTRHIEHGLSPLQAALRGVGEVSGTLVSMALSLAAVFIPIIFMEGVVGRLFGEFALTLVAAIGVSLLLSIATAPMLCSRLLRPTTALPAPGRFGRLRERTLAALLAAYRRSLGWALDHRATMLLALAGVVGLNVYLYTVVPKGFLPQQDTGRLIAFIEGDQSSSFQAMYEHLTVIDSILRQDPAVLRTSGSVGGNGPGGGTVTSARMFVTLKPLGERREPAQAVIERLRPRLARVAGARVFVMSAQEIRIGGRGGSSDYLYTLQSDDLDALRAWEPKIRTALAALPQLADVNTDTRDKGLQTRLVVDREAAARLGLSQRAIDLALNNYFGERLVSTIHHPLNQYRVVMGAAPHFWRSPTVLADIVLVAEDGSRVPLSAVAHWEPGNAPLTVNHQSQFAASTVSFALAPGVPLGEATRAITAAMAQLGVPSSIFGSFEGAARAFQSAGNSQLLLILAAIVAVYLVLGILYESLLHPLTILSTLPSAGIGAVLALLAFGTEFTVIALIGVILLAGIVMKNAIMMIDFALHAQRSRGLAPREAILDACVLRFRPIMMTTAAAILGALPLALGSGDGAELRQPLGIAIVGGLLVGQWLTLYTTPVVYLALDRLRLRLARQAHKRIAAPAAAPAPAVDPA
ncbi:efflux RND transporter permease subunit [Azoarcus olearius]|uniref:RND efflux transporter, permease protein n=1 Tax=Azoarcus sp. (strain BH72) TaxID=418699 RepID=A1K7Z7_AZOSB|nr:efflux RND transporter permease subunit [Azoarcus olearius]CAL94952.1 RND efflux transporter, permease protein [Azoarcus olearius]